MGLAQFILDNIEPILTEWEAFAKSMPPGQEMNSAALRDDAERMLRFVAADMDATQSEGQRAVKGRGEQAAGSDESAANAHGRLRLAQEFDLAQMVSEFRALRASVIRLWSAQPGATPSALSSELIRFNEAIDQILAESVSRYRADMDRARELLLAVLGHDLRNPLSSIRMSAEILARTSLTPRQSDLNDGIIRGSERMRRMVPIEADDPHVTRRQAPGQGSAHRAETHVAEIRHMPQHLLEGYTVADLRGSSTCPDASKPPVACVAT